MLDTMNLQAGWYPIELGSKDFKSCKYSNCKLLDLNATMDSSYWQKAAALIWRCENPEPSIKFSQIYNQ